MITFLGNTISLMRREANLKDLQKRFDLVNHQTYRFENRRRPLRVVALRGRIWITDQGDPHDYLLEAGDRLTICPQGQLVAEGMPDGSFMLEK
jgi:hypothetical protein